MILLRSYFFSLLLIGTLCLHGAASADDRPPAATTARSVGLGGTATALADDATAAFWNPSGIPLLQRQELAFSYADRYGIGLKSNYASYVFPLFESHAIGFDWLREGFHDEELEDSFNLFNATYGLRLHRMLSLGISGKLVYQNIEVDGIKLRSASGFGYDLGLMFTPKVKPFDTFRLGLTLQDVGGTSLRDDNTQVNEEIFEQQLRVGTAYQPRKDLLLSLDVDDRLYLGAEYQPHAVLALRGGFNRDLSPPPGASSTLSYALGFGLRWNNIRVDYAFESHPVLPSTHHASLALSYNPSLVSIKDALVRPSPVFKSLYRTYEAQDFVDVILRNSAQDPLEVTVSIDIPTLTKTPHEETLTLPAQSTERYGFTLTFPQDLLSTQSSYYDNLVQPTVKVTYTQGRRSKTTTKRLSSLYVLGKGKLSWSNARRIAAFVTPESRTVEQFSRGLVARYADTLNRKFARNNLGKAALIFDGLGAYGLRYQQDQTTPYLQIFEDDSVFDSVKYPYEFLQAKIGDCDDCTVIYASMLENLNIPTAALDVNDPEYGHIYMMFDSGIDISDAGDFFTDDKEYVIWQGRLWIPVETTMFGQSFADAWRNGAKEYHVRKERGYINEILISEAQQTFRPGVVPDADIALPSTAALEKLFNRDLTFFDNRLDQIAMASGVSFDDAEGLYDAGATYLRLGQLDRALDSFTKSLALDPTNADAYNGKGVILTRQRQYDEAIPLFQKALELNPNDAGFRINIALTRHLQGRKDDAQRAYQDAVTANREFAGVLDFLSKTPSTVLKTVPAADPLQRLAAKKSYEDGAAFLRLKAEDKALDAFSRALSLDPNNADALNGKGVIATRQKNLDEALQLFRNALLQNPNNAGFHANQAIVYYLQGRKDDAVLAYQKAVQIDPEYRGQLDFITGGEPLPITAGVGSAQPVNRLQRMAAEKAYDDGAAYLRLKADEKALDAFDRALTLDPNNADALNGKGVIATRQKNLIEAVQLYQKATQADPTNAGFYTNLAIAHHLAGRKGDALKAYEKAVQLDPELKGQLDFISANKPTVPTRSAQPIAVSPLQKLTAQKSYAEGATYLRLKAEEKALQAFDRALELDPGNADAYNGKGIVATRQRNYEDAIRFYTRATELDPINAGFHANMAIAYHLQGRKEAAQKAYQKAIELDPSYKGQLEVLEK